jgi:hypothetical protein
MAQLLLRSCAISGGSGKMSGFETRFRTEDDADMIRAAFYDFLDTHAQDADGDARISTELDGYGAKLRVRLWSAEAMSSFLQALQATERPNRRACHE